jgi:hypothetical protein
MPIIIYEGLVNFLNPMSSNDLPRPVTMNGADDGKPKSIKSFTKPSLRMHINHNRHRYSTLGTNNKRRIRIFTKASETCETDSGAPAARAYNLTASLLVNGYTYTREISKERAIVWERKNPPVHSVDPHCAPRDTHCAILQPSTRRCISSSGILVLRNSPFTQLLESVTNEVFLSSSNHGPTAPAFIILGTLSFIFSGNYPSWLFLR